MRGYQSQQHPPILTGPGYQWSAKKHPFEKKQSICVTSTFIECDFLITLIQFFMNSISYDLKASRHHENNLKSPGQAA